jgi:dihydrofolate synthase/folylpolyglutamate synthase
MEINSKLNKLFSKTASGIKPGLEITKKLLNNLGNPHNNFITIHIAGTNAKGSTASYIAAILEQSGFKTGLYTSPHLYDFRERIKISNKMIDHNSLIRLFELVEKADNGERKATFFEFTTALAFKYFEENKVDAAVIETGMGGKFDSTNLVTPHLSVITNVTMDHSDFLGNRIELIAEEKAGIIKNNVPVLTGEQNKKVLKIIKKKAENTNSPLFIINKDFEIKQENGNFFLSDCDKVLLKPLLKGKHQIINSGISAFACLLLNRFYPEIFKIEKNQIEKAIKKTLWRGRLEVLSKSPEFIVDCAHNPDSCRVLKEYLEEKPKKITFVFGSLNDKDYQKNLKILEPLAEKFIFTKPDSPRALEPQALKKLTRINSIIEQDPVKACLKAVEKASPNDIICVAGSIYLSGKIIEAFDKNKLKSLN